MLYLSYNKIKFQIVCNSILTNFWLRVRKYILQIIVSINSDQSSGLSKALSRYSYFACASKSSPFSWLSRLRRPVLSSSFISSAELKRSSAEKHWKMAMIMEEIASSPIWHNRSQKPRTKGFAISSENRPITHFMTK